MRNHLIVIATTALAFAVQSGHGFLLLSPPRHHCSSASSLGPSEPQRAFWSKARATVAPIGGSMTNETSVDLPSENDEEEVASFPDEKSSSGKKPRNAKRRPRNRSNKVEDVYNLNDSLNRLAEEASDFRKPVIRKAMSAEELWKEFHHDDKAKPDIVSFNIVLKAWSKATHVLADHHDDHRNQDHLYDPDIPIYTARECATHALELLNEQERLYSTQQQKDEESSSDSHSKSSVVAPDAHSYNTLMDMWAKSYIPEAITQVEDLLRRLQKSPDLEADVVSYNSLIDAYAFSTRSDRLEKLRKIYQYMNETPEIKPNARTINSILHSYSRLIKDQSLNYSDQEAMQLAEEAMEKFEDLKRRFAEEGRPEDEPDVLSFTTAMDVYAKVGTLSATRKVEALFQEMKQKSSGLNLSPNLYSYTTLMTAWSRVASAEEAPGRAQDILTEMIADPNLTSINHRPFTAALRCWSRGHVPKKAVRALNTLKQMKELSKTEPYAAPNIQTYHAALECCAKSNDADISQYTVALKIAFAILQSMTKDEIVANHLTYSKLLRCVEALLPAGPERNQVALAAFEKARAAGMVESNVIQAFKKAADVQVALDTLQDISDHNGYCDYSRIPFAWKKNIKF